MRAIEEQRITLRRVEERRCVTVSRPSVPTSHASHESIQASESRVVSGAERSEWRADLLGIWLAKDRPNRSRLVSSGAEAAGVLSAAAVDSTDGDSLKSESRSDTEELRAIPRYHI